MKNRNTILKKALAMAISISLLAPPVFSGVNRYEFNVKVPEYTPSTVSFSGAKEIESYAKGKFLPSQGYYRDASAAGVGSQVAKLTAVGAIDRKSSNFSPYAKLDGYHSMELIIGLAGGKEAVKTRAASTSQGYKSSVVEARLLREYFEEAKTRGIILPSEEKYINKTVPRYLFATWLGRAAKIQAAEPVQNGVMGFDDYRSIPSNYRDMIEGLYEKGIIRGSSGSTFAPESPITKKDAVTMMDRALPDVYTTLGITEDSGLALGKKRTVKNQYSDKIITQNIYIKRADGTIAKVTAKSSSKTNQGSDFIYDNNGKITGASGISVGQEFKMLLKNSKVVYAERTSGNTVFSALGNKAGAQTGLESNYGRVVNKKIEFFYENGKKYYTSRIRVENYDAEVIDIVVKNKIQLSVANSLLISKSGVPKGLDSLVVGDFLEYGIKSPNKIVFAQLKKVQKSTAKGEIVEVKKDAKSGLSILTIYDSGKNLQHWPVAEFAQFSFGGAPANAKDLISGQSVNFNVVNNFITSGTIDGFENSGYIPIQFKKRTGVVYKVTSASIVIREQNGSKVTYSHNSIQTTIQKGDSAIPYSRVKPGDKVRLYFDTITSSTPSRIEVEAVTLPVKNIYKGVVGGIDNGTGQLTITSVKYLENNGWTADSSYMREFDFGKSPAIYSGTKKITQGELISEYQGKSIYLAMEDSYGNEEIARAVVSSGYEMSYYDKVSTIDKVYGQMELRNGRNFGVDASTIVIENGRIIPYDLIDENENVLVVADTDTGLSNASIVSIVPKSYDVFGNVHIGAIKEVTPGTFNMTYYGDVSQNRFTTASSSTSGYYKLHNDSVIRDKDTGKVMNYASFFHGPYSEEDNYNLSSPAGLKQKHYYGIFITDDKGQVIELDLSKSQIIKNKNIDDAATSETLLLASINNILSNATFTKGVVEEFDSTWQRVKIKNSSDFVSGDDSWKPNPVSVWIKYDNSLIVKDGKAATSDDIKAGDQISIVRSGENSMAMIVEN